MTSNNLQESLNADLKRLFPKTGKIGLRNSVSIIRTFHRSQIDHLTYVLSNDRMNHSRRPTVLTHLLRMEIQTELPEWIADFDVRGADPNSRIVQCALELEGSDCI